MANLGMLGALGGLGEGLIHKAAEDRKDERAAIDEAREKRIADLKNLRDTAAASTLATAKVTAAETKTSTDATAATALGENRLAVAKIGAGARRKDGFTFDDQILMGPDGEKSYQIRRHAGRGTIEVFDDQGLKTYIPGFSVDAKAPAGDASFPTPSPNSLAYFEKHKDDPKMVEYFKTRYGEKALPADFGNKTAPEAKVKTPEAKASKKYQLDMSEATGVPAATKVVQENIIDPISGAIDKIAANNAVYGALKSHKGLSQVPIEALNAVLPDANAKDKAVIERELQRRAVS